MKLIILMLVLLMPFISQAHADEPMTQAHMEDIVRSIGTDSRGRPGFLEFAYSGVQLMCISDKKNNRMRLIAPIGDYSAVSPEQKDLMFAANFHTALDARYAVSQGVLFAAFIHPLSTLDEAEITSAIIQVASLVQTFGTTYSSSVLSFGGGTETEQDKPDPSL